MTAKMATDEVGHSAALGIAGVLGLAEAAPAPRSQLGADLSLHPAADLDGRRIAAQAEVGLLTSLARPSRKRDDVRGLHGVAAAFIARIGHELSGLDQEPAVGRLVTVLLEIALVALEFDDVIHPLEGQVECAAAQLRDQLPARLGLRVVERRL